MSSLWRICSSSDLDLSDSTPEMLKERCYGNILKACRTFCACEAQGVQNVLNYVFLKSLQVNIPGSL